MSAALEFVPYLRHIKKAYYNSTLQLEAELVHQT